MSSDGVVKAPEFSQALLICSYQSVRLNWQKHNWRVFCQRRGTNKGKSAKLTDYLAVS